MSEGRGGHMRLVSGAALVGSALEWYDMFLYGTAAALVFNKIMFPSGSALASTLAAFATYAVGFLARPLGGIVFGRIGDRVGRKRVLLLTLLMMGGATTVIGLVPSYASIGVAAPILLVVLRLIQGIGAGAEFGGAAILTVEHAPARSRGLHGAWPVTGVYAGLALASAVFSLLSLLPTDAFLAWGWRVPFLASVLIIVVALVIRMRVAETPAFQEMAEQRGTARAPVATVLRTYWKPLLVLAGEHIAENGIGYVYQVFVITYVADTLGMDGGGATFAVAVASVGCMVTAPLFGALSDRIGRRPVLLFGTVFSLAFAFPFFWMLDARTDLVVVLGTVMGLSIGVSAMFAPQGSYFSELFPTEVRLTAMSLGREAVSAIVGGFTPMIAVLLVELGGGRGWLVAAFVAVLALIGTIAVRLGPETRGVAFTSEDTAAPVAAGQA